MLRAPLRCENATKLKGWVEPPFLRDDGVVPDQHLGVGLVKPGLDAVLLDPKLGRAEVGVIPIQHHVDRRVLQDDHDVLDAKKNRGSANAMMRQSPTIMTRGPRILS
jgi:hypothetical protein